MRMSLTDLGQAGAKSMQASEVLHHKRFPMKETVGPARPALMYGSNCWVVKKSQEHRMQVAEMRMFQCVRVAGSPRGIGLRKSTSGHTLGWQILGRRCEHHLWRFCVVMSRYVDNLIGVLFGLAV